MPKLNDLLLKFKTIMDKKNTYLIISGVVGLGGLVAAAIYFSSGMLFKGDLLVFPLSCQANPSTIAIDGKVHNVTWSAYAGPSPAVANWNGDFGTNSTVNKYNVSEVSASYNTINRTDGQVINVTAYTGDQKAAPTANNTTTCTLTFKKVTINLGDLAGSGDAFEALGQDSVAAGALSKYGEPEDLGTISQKCTPGTTKTITCTDSEQMKSYKLVICKADGTWPGCTALGDLPMGGADKTSAWGVKGCGANPSFPMINNPIEFQIHATTLPSSTFSYAWTGSNSKGETCTSTNPKALCTFKQGGNVTMKLKITQTVSPFDYAQTSCTVPVSICENLKYQPCDGGKGSQQCMGTGWSTCSSAVCQPGQELTVTCPAGYSGNAIQTCTSNGTYGPVDTTTCKEACTSGETRQGTCASGKHETCTAAKTWDGICVAGSAQPVCTPGEKKTQKCPDGINSQTTTCNSTGTEWSAWSPITCKSGGDVICTANKYETKACPGSNVNQVRSCNADGTNWSVWSPATCPAPQSDGTLKTGGGTTTGGTTTGGTTTTVTSASLKPKLELISCTGTAESFAPKARETITMDCTVSPSDKTIKMPLLTAMVIKGKYDAKNGLTIDEEIKSFGVDKPLDMGTRTVIRKTFTWNGIDEADRPVTEGDFLFAVGARKDATYNYDMSIHPFKVTAESAVAEKEQEPAVSEQPQQPAGTTTTTTTATAPEQEPPPAPEPPEASKCPGINYMRDIKGHWAEQYLRRAIDACMFTGYPDGTFRPDNAINRSEAVKGIIMALKEPLAFCWDNDCGTPYLDLPPNIGAWIRPAWLLKIIKDAPRFYPAAAALRGDVLVMLGRAAPKYLPPRQGCWSANCGAGQPDNIFTDIYNPLHGQYIRTFADAGIVNGVAPHIFAPERPMTRAEFVKLLLTAMDKFPEAFK